MGQTKRNLGYQTVYQILNTCIPLITSPYLARVLGSERQGVFSFTQSIVNYFTLIAMLGVVNYGSRTIAEYRNNYAVKSMKFWNIYAIQFISTSISSLGYIFYLVFFCKEHYLIATIQGLYLVGNLFDINWLYFGIEKFKTTVIRSIFIRISSVVLILLFVNKPNDLWFYTIIMAGSTLLSNLVLWFILPKEIDMTYIKSIKWEEMIIHIKPNIILFVPLLAMSVYHIMDKTMLGILSTYDEVGYYYNADKIINIPIGIISGVGTVMLPRMTRLIEESKIEEANRIFNLSVESVFAASIAMACGIASISKEFTPFFFGKGFEPCITLITVLSPVLIIKGLSQTSRMQYLIPSHKENIFLQSVIIGALVNLVVNIVLIPDLGAMGAVIGTLAAEMVTCAWQYIKMNKYFCVLKSIYKSFIYLLFGCIMYFLVRVTGNMFCKGIICLLLEILVGSLVYVGLCILYWKFTKSTIIDIFIKKTSKIL